jgi:hypothetical protein
MRQIHRPRHRRKNIKMDLKEITCNSTVLCGSFYRGRGYDIDAHDTEINLEICDKADSESAYIERHL